MCGKSSKCNNNNKHINTLAHTPIVTSVASAITTNNMHDNNKCSIKNSHMETIESALTH